MTKNQALEYEIEELKIKNSSLEHELERKDEMHLHELKTMRDYLQNLMNKHCLN